MKGIYYILTGLTLGIILLSGCIQQGENSNINQGAPGTTIVNEETMGGPKQTGPPKESPAFQIDYSSEYLASASDISGFEMKKTGSAFVAYYHSGDETNANKALAVLEQGGLSLYKKYLGFEPKGVPVYLATSADEYVKIADFPGGKENVEVGDGSAPNGKIYLYKPFEETRSGKTEGMIIHEGVHAAIFQYMGQDKIQYIPGFLNEGSAHYIEYVFKAGPGFDPLEQIYHSDLLINGVETGNPQLLGLDELGQKCDGYIAEETLNFLCRGQGAYTVWYINETYGNEAFGKFLGNVKQTRDWQKALNNLTGKTTSQFGQEIYDNLKSRVEQRKR
ncbi:MAG TPA: hypothetical protein VIO58_09485 [Candidatus Methanoperedens sp.]